MKEAIIELPCACREIGPSTRLPAPLVSILAACQIHLESYTVRVPLLGPTRPTKLGTMEQAWFQRTPGESHVAG